MRVAVFLLALGMLLTGSINTVSVKFQDMMVVGHSADGSPLHFKHPVVQAAFMFFGESLCLIPYFLLRWHKWSRRKAGLELPSKRPKQPRGFFIKRALMFSIPALCDSMASVLLNLGLFYTNASTYQMLRGTLVLFAGTFTVLLLRRRLFLHHWIGMILITAGAMIVGAASIVYSNSQSPPPSPAPLSTPGYDAEGAGLDGSGVEAGLLAAIWAPASGLVISFGQQLSKALGRIKDEAATDALLGDILVVVAQAFAALQFIVEEKLLGTFKMQPLVAVGLEGMWGMVLCLFALPLVPLLHDSRGRPLDDLPSALREMAANPRLLGAVLLGIMSIGAFNFFGLSVTKALSGASRATIDACRTLFVWVVAIGVGWETFHDLQVVGFLVLVAGTSLYNEILRTCLPHVYPSPSQPGREDDDANSSCSSTSYLGASNDNDLEAPLLLVESNGTSRVPAAGTGHHQPMRIPQHHVEAQHYMARSLTLGVTALSPQPLDYEDTKPYSVSKLVGDILNVSPTGSSLTADASLMRSRTSGELDGGSARGSGTALSQYEQRQEEASEAAAHAHAGLCPAPPPPSPALSVAVGLGSGSKSPSKAPGVPSPTAEGKQAVLSAASGGVEEEDSTECPPEEAAHLSHVYKPGGQLQHALAAAGQVHKPAAGPEGPSAEPSATAAGAGSGSAAVVVDGDAGSGSGLAAAGVAVAGGSSSGPAVAAVAAAAPVATGAAGAEASGSAGGASSGAAAAPAAAGAAAGAGAAAKKGGKGGAKKKGSKKK